MPASSPTPCGPSANWSLPITGIMLVQGQPNRLNSSVTSSAPTRRGSRRTTARPSAMLASTGTITAIGAGGVRGRRSTATTAGMYSSTLSRKAPSSPTVASTTPPSVGPSTRLPLLVATSTDIATPIRAGPTTWPIIARRIGLSDAQATPFMKEAIARCHTATTSAKASIAITADVAACDSTTSSSACRLSIRSAAAPRKAPNSPIGSSRSMVSMATTNAEPVAA